MWDVLVNYVTGKAQNTEIMKNVIDERNHLKVKSLEETTLRKKSRFWKKKSRIHNFFKNDNISMSANDQRVANSVSPMKHREIRSSRNLTNLTITNDQNHEKSEMMPKNSTNMMRTFSPTEGTNRTYLKPIVPMYLNSLFNMVLAIGNTKNLRSRSWRLS